MAFKTLESAIEYIDKLERKLEIYENVLEIYENAFDKQNDLIDELMKGGEENAKKRRCL